MEKINYSKKEYQKENGINKFIKLKNKTLNLIARVMLFPGIRIAIYRLMGVKIGKKVFIGLDCYIDDEVPSAIKIEDNVIIAFRVTIAAHDDTGGKTVSPVIIRDGCYIGTGAIILPGVELGKNVTVGAGAVVTKSFDKDSKIIGVPARII